MMNRSDIEQHINQGHVQNKEIRLAKRTIGQQRGSHLMQESSRSCSRAGFLIFHLRNQCKTYSLKVFSIEHSHRTKPLQQCSGCVYLPCGSMDVQILAVTEPGPILHRYSDSSTTTSTICLSKFPNVQNYQWKLTPRSFNPQGEASRNFTQILIAHV